MQKETYYVISGLGSSDYHVYSSNDIEDAKKEYLECIKYYNNVKIAKDLQVEVTIKKHD